jgi:hypothetical protein
MFYLFQTHVSSALSRCCICCNDYVANVCSKCFIFQTYVAIVLAKYCKNRSGCKVVERGRES